MAEGSCHSKCKILLSASFRQILGPTKSPIQWTSGALTATVKQPGLAADHSHPTSAGVKDAGIYA